MTTSNARYRLQYEMRADAMIDAVHLHQSGIYRLVTFAVALMLLSALILAAMASAFADLRWLLLVAGLLAAWGTLTLVVARGRRLLRWGVRRNARSVLGGTVELMLGDDGITTTARYSSGFVPWSQLTGVREDERTVLFVRDRVLLGYAPSTAFASAEHRAAVLRFAREQIERADDDGASRG